MKAVELPLSLCVAIVNRLAEFDKVGLV